ncbi:MAG: hypothetical protein ACRD0X_08460 [Thermoanaerobaculia bacterium]
MSLKAFHLLFIALAVLMCVYVAAWGVGEYLHRAAGGSLALGLGCLLLAGILVVYGVRVWRKLQALPR